MKSLLLCFLLHFVCNTSAYNILVVYPLPILSVNFLGQGVVRQLLKDGHEVTYISTHPIKEPHSKNLRQIDVSQNRALFENPNDTTWSIKTILDDKFEIKMSGYLDSAAEIAQLTFANENVTNLLQNSNEHFDAIIADWMESDVYSGLSALYNCPMMWVFSMGAHWQVLRLIADPSSPAYDTDYYGANIPPFTFTQRVQELYSRIRWNLHKILYIKPIERQIYGNTFGPLLAKNGRTLPNYDEIIYNASMIFGNEHNAVLGTPSTPQNFKYIGGIHIADPVKPLPKDLQNLMDNAPNGIIYFSMGSFLKSKELPMKFVTDVLSVFGELKETVIWKYEDILKDVPKNVHIVKWAPQQSILAHPNCKIFISHGGLLSTIETIHFGKPIIGVPALLDQIMNIDKAVANGFAIKVKLDYKMPANLKPAIKTMLSNDTYEKRAKELSFIYHDRPMKPGDELIYWVRHVIRTRGALHLRSPAINVPLYQRLYLDLLALIIACIFIFWRFLTALLKTKSGTKKNLAKKKKN